MGLAISITVIIYCLTTNGSRDRHHMTIHVFTSLLKLYDGGCVKKICNDKNEWEVVKEQPDKKGNVLIKVRFVHKLLSFNLTCDSSFNLAILTLQFQQCSKSW